MKKYKNNLIMMVTLVTMLFSSKLSAQKVTVYFNNTDVSVYKDTVAQYSAFSAVYSAGKTYLDWEVRYQHVDGVYIIYYSLDDINYKQLGHKAGIGVPVDFPIAYYFQHEHPQQGTIFYKIVHIAGNKTYCVSPKIQVNINESSLSSTY